MKNKEKELPAKVSPEHEEEFHGYTMEELRYQRAILAVKREFLKEKALKEVHKVKAGMPFVNGNSAFGEITPKGVVGKLVKGLNLFDYLMLGFQAVRIGKKMTSVFRKK